MLYISYYGNIYDKNKDLENEPSYIINAINNGYNVFIDIQLIKNDYYLGGKYKIELDFLYKYIDYLWCNCLDEITYISLRNISNIIKIINDLKDIVWGYYEINNNNFISVLPELSKNNYEIRDLKNKSNFIGICSSYIGWYKQLFETSIYYALTVNGRLTCHQENLFPKVIKYLNENKNEWIDLHIAINDYEEKTELYLNDKYMDFPFIATFSCKKFIIHDKYVNHHYRANEYNNNNIQNMISNFYTLSIVSNQVFLFNKYYNYNLIIKYRPDIVCECMPQLNNFLNIEKNNLLTPNIHKYGYNGGIINDQICIGNPSDIYKYFTIYKYIDEYLYKDNIILHPETLLYHHLKKHNINIISFDYNYDLNINRSLIK